jgi:hypothetical protein
LIVHLEAKKICSIAYKSIITDGKFSSLLKSKIEKNNVKSQSLTFQSQFEHSSISTHKREGVHRGNEVPNKQSEKIWSAYEEFPYTGKRYRRNRVHMGLRSRIARNSDGALPKTINLVTTRDVVDKDISTIRDFTTISRGIRKCGLAVFSECSRMAISCLGATKDCSIRSYSCKSISSSVLDLSKNTSAGADTFGKKNDPIVQKRVLSQVRDIFRKPTSFNLIIKNPSLYVDSTLFKMFTLLKLYFIDFKQLMIVKLMNVMRSRE